MRSASPRHSFFRYVFLPGVWPRTVELFGTGFPLLSGLLAYTFGLLRLLPPDHPYLIPSNARQFSCLQVMRAAAANLEFSWRQADRVLAFFAILSGLVMLAIQFILMVVALIVAPASAQEFPTTYEGFFQTNDPKEDIAFKMLNLVFGIPGMFGMEESGKQPFHDALHALMQFYSFGILLIGFFLLIYITIVIVAETAQSGTPFGQRFTKPWAPLRLIIFFALLIPISNGMNAAQYIVLYAAKGGSGLATNGWRFFNDTLAMTPMGDKEALIAYPTAPDLSSLPAFIMLAKTCQMAVAHKLEFKPKVGAWVIYNNQSEELGKKTFQDITAELTKDSRGGYDFKVRFGEKNDAYQNEPGKVSTHCGELHFYTSDISEPGAALIQQTYFEMVQHLWKGASGDTDGEAGFKNEGMQALGESMRKYAYGFYKAYITDDRSRSGLPPDKFRESWAKYINSYMYVDKAYFDDDGNYLPPDKKGKPGGQVVKAVEKQIEEGDLEMEEKILKLGWAGAAIWYNKIAQQNGALVSSLQHFPVPSRYPEIMEYVATHKTAAGDNISVLEKYNPSQRENLKERVVGEYPIMVALNQVYVFWQKEEASGDAAAERRRVTDNIIVDSINMLFGTSGLFEMCRNTNVHPLAQLSALGKGMIDHAIRGFAGTILMGLAGSAASLLSNYLGQAGFAASSLMMTIASIGLMAGFILYYLMPFLPFMYFFFAAGAWLKGIFEAMVGAPLWALGHLRIDGQGIVGEAARDGYFMILEIFIRPILIIFGLIASLAIFGAMVKVLNDIFYLVLSNLAGSGGEGGFCFTDTDSTALRRGPIDEFFYTIVYTVVVYMIGMSSFKLIDSIPRNIMRWLGEEVAAFGDQAGDAAEGLMMKMTASGGVIGSKLEGGLGDVSENLKSFGKQAGQSLQDMTK